MPRMVKNTFIYSRHAATWSSPRGGAVGHSKENVFQLHITWSFKVILPFGFQTILSCFFIQLCFTLQISFFFCFLICQHITLLSWFDDGSSLFVPALLSYSLPTVSSRPQSPVSSACCVSVCVYSCVNECPRVSAASLQLISHASA